LGRRAGAVTLSQPAVVLRRNPLLLASSVDPREQRKPDACLRMVRLTEHAPQRPVSEGSYRQVRNDRRPVSGEPANARLTAETKPFEVPKPRCQPTLPSWGRPPPSDLAETIGADRAAWVAVPRRWAMSRRRRHGPHISWREGVAAEESSETTRTADADTSRIGAPHRTSQSRVPISTSIGRFSSIRRACSNETVRSSCSSTQV
jgi:hypothetical protein